MNKILNFVQRHPAPVFFALAFAFTWGAMAAVIGPGGFPISAAQFEAVGPMVYVAMLVGPSAAGLVMTGLVHGRPGFRALGSRLTKWRVGARWYAAALLGTPLLAIGLLLALSLLSDEFIPAIFTANDSVSLMLTGLAIGLVVALFEELGWSGFVVPGLLRRYGVLQTGLLVGFLWGAWHFLPFWESGSFSGAFPLALLLGRLFSWLPPFRVLMVWVYDRTGSLLVVILMHASLVATLNSIVPLELSGSALLTWILAWAVVLWLLVGGYAAIKGGETLSQPVEQKKATTS